MDNEASPSPLNRAATTACNARKTFSYIKPDELGTNNTKHIPILIAGGGPVGLAMAIELAKYNIESIVLEKTNTLGDGSRAICWAKRTLEICDRLGSATRMVDKGITWNIGKVYSGDKPEPIYTFDLLPDKSQKFPAFINLQQFYAEEYFLDLFPDIPQTEIRWKNEIIAIEHHEQSVLVTIDTPDGEYQLSCDYLIAADGCRSPIRGMLNLDFEGKVFEDHFLIVDIKMNADFPAERRFWFNPPFNPGMTSLLHKQPDNIWRLDFQLGWDIDREEALKEENVSAKVEAMIGKDVDYEYDWMSIYTFQCRRMKKFIHDRVIFAGDSAHLVSPFGARGANGGIQDIDNLGWKLAWVLKGHAPEKLLHSYDTERILGADENIINSSRSTDFLTPKNAASCAFRDAILELANDFSFARHFVNSGRLSVPCELDNSPLNTDDISPFKNKQRPGTVCMDAPITKDGKPSWLLNQLGGRFVGLYFTKSPDLANQAKQKIIDAQLPITLIPISEQGVNPGQNFLVDTNRLAYQHYDARAGTIYLVRPDQHIAARWREFDINKIKLAYNKAIQNC